MEGGVVIVNGGVDDDLIDDIMLLPPGFRFHPTDEEIITYYLMEKVIDSKFTAKAIGEVDLNRCEPWDLPKQAKMGEKEWFFFCQRDRKYPTGMRTNRATESGYWKATGKDKEIEKGKGNLVGMKKTLVFYKGRAPKGEKTNWVMHEYRLQGKLSYHNFSKSKDEWVVSKVFHKNSGMVRRNVTEFERMGSFVVDHLLDTPSLPDLIDLPNVIHNNIPQHSSYNNGSTDQEEYKALSTSLSRASGNENFFNVSNSLKTTHQWPQMPPDYNYKFSSHHHGSSSNSAPISMNYSSYQPSSNLSYQHVDVHIHNQNQVQFKMGQNPSNNSVGVYNQKNLVQCKMEQFSSNNSRVSISQDTGVSTDVGHEISSSVISKPPPPAAANGIDDKPFEDLECLSVGPNIISDLDHFWDYSL